MKGCSWRNRVSHLFAVTRHFVVLFSVYWTALDLYDTSQRSSGCYMTIKTSLLVFSHCVVLERGGISKQRDLLRKQSGNCSVNRWRFLSLFRSVHSAHYQMAQPFRNRSMLTMYNTGKTVVPKRRIMRKTFASQALMGTYVCHERTATTKEEKRKITPPLQGGMGDLTCFGSLIVG